MITSWLQSLSANGCPCFVAAWLGPNYKHCFHLLICNSHAFQNATSCSWWASSHPTEKPDCRAEKFTARGFSCKIQQRVQPFLKKMWNMNGISIRIYPSTKPCGPWINGTEKVVVEAPASHVSHSQMAAQKRSVPMRVNCGSIFGKIHQNLGKSRKFCENPEALWQMTPLTFSKLLVSAMSQDWTIQLFEPTGESIGCWSQFWMIWMWGSL